MRPGNTCIIYEVLSVVKPDGTFNAQLKGLIIF